MLFYPGKVHQTISIQHHRYLRKMGANGLQQDFFLIGKVVVIFQATIALLPTGLATHNPQGGIRPPGSLIKKFLRRGKLRGIGDVFAKNLVHQTAIDSILYFCKVELRGIVFMIGLELILVPGRERLLRPYANSLQRIYYTGRHTSPGSSGPVAGEHRIPLGPSEQGDLRSLGQWQYSPFIFQQHHRALNSLAGSFAGVQGCTSPDILRR